MSLDTCTCIVCTRLSYHILYDDYSSLLPLSLLLPSLYFLPPSLSLPPPPAYHHLSKVVEASRVHLFDIVTQYRAIFPDDDTALAGYSAGRAGGGGAGMEGTLFYSWVGEKVRLF